MQRLAKKDKFNYQKPTQTRPEMPAGPALLAEGYWLISQQRGVKDENVGPFGSASQARSYAQTAGPPEPGYQGWYLVKSDGKEARYTYDDTKYFQRTGAARHNVLFHHEATYNREYNARAPKMAKPAESLRALSATLNKTKAALNKRHAAILPPELANLPSKFDYDRKTGGFTLELYADAIRDLIRHHTKDPNITTEQNGTRWIVYDSTTGEVFWPGNNSPAAWETALAQFIR